jgi:hypothetical protein
MKGVSKASADRSIIVVKDGDGFELRVWNRFTGDGPIGVRLTRKHDLPELPTKTSSYQSALDLQQRWQSWLDDNPLSGRKKGRK